MLGCPSWNSDQNDFSYFWSTSHPNTSYQIDFQDGNCGGHPVFPIGTILAIFNLQVTSTILTKFQANWRPTEQFQLILVYPSSLRFLPSFESFSLSVHEKKPKISFQVATMVAILDFQSQQF